MLPKVYNSRMDVDPDFVPEFTDWYKRRHGPDVVAVGMYSAHGYQAVVGSPWICSFYEIPGVGVFNATYDRTRMADQQLDVIVAEKIFNHSLMIYDQVLTEGIADSVHDDPHRPSLAGTVIGPAVSTIRFDVPDRTGPSSWSGTAPWSSRVRGGRPDSSGAGLVSKRASTPSTREVSPRSW